MGKSGRDGMSLPLSPQVIKITGVLPVLAVLHNLAFILAKAGILWQIGKRSRLKQKMLRKMERKSGMFKFFKMPEKEPEEGLNTADRLYLIKLIVIMGVVTASISIFGTMLLLEHHLNRMGDKAKAMMEWSKKADLANEMLNDMFKVQQMKESYESQGIGATEEKEE